MSPNTLEPFNNKNLLEEQRLDYLFGFEDTYELNSSGLNLLLFIVEKGQRNVSSVVPEYFERLIRQSDLKVRAPDSKDALWWIVAKNIGISPELLDYVVKNSDIQTPYADDSTAAMLLLRHAVPHRVLLSTLEYVLEKTDLSVYNSQGLSASYYALLNRSMDRFVYPPAFYDQLLTHKIWSPREADFIEKEDLKKALQECRTEIEKYHLEQKIQATPKPGIKISKI